MKIKVCGMRERSNILELSGLKPDYMGLIFYPKSARFVDHIDADLLSSLADDIIITGVFVNEAEDSILQKVKQYNLKAIQLHGDETPQYCYSLRQALSASNINVQMIKAFGVDSHFQFDILGSYVAVVDYFLFDTKSSSYGGAGVKFDWEILKGYSLDKPYFLSGGISLKDISELTMIEDERLYAIDINSRFESAPAVKNMEQVRIAVQIIRNSGNHTPQRNQY